MQGAWFEGVSKEKKQEFKELVQSAKIVLDKLQEMVYNRINNGERVSQADYDSPSWAYKQADRNGYLRAYREFLSLLDVSDREQ